MIDYKKILTEIGCDDSKVQPEYKAINFNCDAIQSDEKQILYLDPFIDLKDVQEVIAAKMIGIHFDTSNGHRPSKGSKETTGLYLNLEKLELGSPSDHLQDKHLTETRIRELRSIAEKYGLKWVTLRQE